MSNMHAFMSNMQVYVVGISVGSAESVYKEVTKIQQFYLYEVYDVL